jgi:glycosyltransferase involved in cell wall biosynthesis
VLQAGGKLEPEFLRHGIRVIAPGANLPSILQRLHAVILLFRQMLFCKPDITHFFLPEAYLIGGVIALLTGCRNRIMSRRSLNNYQHEHPTAARIEKWMHGRMSVVLGNSQAVVDQLQLEEGVAPSHVGLIHNGVDIDSFKQMPTKEVVRDKMKIVADALVFVIVANLIHYKGHTDLLEAMGSVKDFLPADWVLLCVGRDDGMLDVLKRQADSLGLDDNIRWVGECDDITEVLAVADIGILCSHQEGFSNSLLEGMAAGLPMIATDVGGNVDALVDHVTGLLVPPKAPTKLAQSIRLLVDDAGLRKSMGEEGRKRVRERFSLGNCVAKYQRLYDCVHMNIDKPISELLNSLEDC